MVIYTNENKHRQNVCTFQAILKNNLKIFTTMEPLQRKNLQNNGNQRLAKIKCYFIFK